MRKKNKKYFDWINLDVISLIIIIIGIVDIYMFSPQVAGGIFVILLGIWKQIIGK